MLGKSHILSLFPTPLIISVKHEHSCKILYVSNFIEAIGRQGLNNQMFLEIITCDPSLYKLDDPDFTQCVHGQGESQGKTFFKVRDLSGNFEIGLLLWIFYFFCGSFMFLFCLVFAMFCARLFICALWSPAGKGLTSWLSFVVSSVSLSLSHWYPGSGVVLDCIDS